MLAYFRELEPLGGGHTEKLPGSDMNLAADGRQAFACRGPLAHRFLGVPCCYRGFQRHTRIYMWRTRKNYARGDTTYKHPGFQRHCPRTEEMQSALLMLVEFLRNSSPFQNPDPDKIPLPFSQKKVLWKMLLRRYEATQGSSPAGPSMCILFSRRPRLRTFYRVLRTCRALAKVRFHRVVKIGRCPKCCYLRWKCLSAIAPGERNAWQNVAAKHQELQLAQKHVYATDRARAAQDYPNTEIYMAFDGGSGHEFWLPHFSAKSDEVMSKVADGKHTPGFKIMNGLVHGDVRSHVIISPASVVAGSNHTCECIAIAINTAFDEHGDLPRKFSVQLDNATNNHSILVFTFIALYVLMGVFDEARIRFELPDHAHDIYDLFQAIHKTAVCDETFFTLEELINIIKSAHRGGINRSSSATREATKALMGADVLVSNLWEVRDFWEWLFPGHSKRDKESFARGAGIYYENVKGFHDFTLRRLRGIDGEVQVGLWGKRYMSGPTLRFLGTLTTWNLYTRVTQNKEPQIAPRQTSEGKSADRWGSILDQLQKLTKGPFAEQFSEERLADAMAICREDWGHFRNSSGAQPEKHRWMPKYLAAVMLRRGLRRPFGNALQK